CPLAFCTLILLHAAPTSLSYTLSLHDALPICLAAKVRFTGFLGGEDKLAALVDADVVVQTSRYEQGAWAPFEAVLCGTPIVVSRNSGAGEDVKRIDAGYLVDFGDRAELRDTLAYVLDHPDEARQKARTAKAYIEA